MTKKTSNKYNQKHPNNIIINNVTFGYNKKNKIFTDLSLVLPHGKIIGIIGKNGTGKSTLLELIAQVLDPQKGSVTIGENIKKDRRYTRSHISSLSQELVITLSGKIKNILKLSIALEGGKKKALYNKLISKKILTQKMNELSMGEQRIVQICLTLLKDRDVYLLDEPTAHLDTQKRKIFWDIILKLKKKEKTCIIIAHNDIDLENNADLIFLIKKNKIEKIK